MRSSGEFTASGRRVGRVRASSAAFHLFGSVRPVPAPTRGCCAAVARVGLASAGAGARFSVCTLARTGHAAPPERLSANDAAVRRCPIAIRGRSPAVRGAWSAIVC
jgi:hypothetical protein